MAGVTTTGFVPKRLNEIIASLKENAKPIFQDLVPPGEEVDVSDTSTIGRLIGLIAPDMDELWQAAEEVYQAFDPNSATGVALDNICQYIGITRQQGRPTILRTSVWGLTNTFLPQGQVVRDDENNRYISTTQLTFTISDAIGFAISPTTVVDGQENRFTIITEDGIYSGSYTATTGDTVETVLDAWKLQFDAYSLERVEYEVKDGKFYVVLTDYFSYITIPSAINSAVVETKKRLTFNSEVEGDISVPLGTVKTILTPIYGWLSVDNEVSAEKGSVYETDEQLRYRFSVSKAVRSTNTSEALYSQLLELNDVEAVRIYENTSNVVDTLGLPAHTFMAVVKGGTDTDIGEIIWNNKPMGITSHGSTNVTVRDSQNFERVVKFSRAQEVPVYVSVVVSKTDNNLPDNAQEQIRSAVVEYINSRNTFGEDVVYTRLFTPINNVPGHQVDSLFIGTTSSPTGTSNIIMSFDQYPVILPEFVEVTVNN